MPKLSYLIILFFFTFSAAAQETTAEITGIVADNEGFVAKATVTALHIPTGTLYSTTTRKDGRYNLPNLKIGGPYTVTVHFVGYKEEKQDDIMLLLGQPFKADFVLTEDFNILNSIVVASVLKGKDKIFNSNRTGSQEIITSIALERLPTTNRSLKDFTRLTPFSNGLSFGGRNGLFNNVAIDGVNFNNSFGNTTTQGIQIPTTPVGLETIEQIQINVSPFDVRQGGFTGAGINAVSRSGTNTFKASVYGYLSGPGTQGYNVGNITVPKDTFNYNLKGFFVGGPIIKNKLFFFINGEKEILNSPATSFVASDASHLPGGNVSVANADTLNKLRQFLIDKYGYDPGTFQGYSYKTEKDRFSAKIDWNINPKNTFTFKYTYSRSYKETPVSNSGAPGGRQPGVTELPFSGTGFLSKIYFNIFIGELNTRFNNKASNKIQIGYVSLRNSRSSLAVKDFPFVDILNGQGQSYTAFGYEPLSYNNILYTDVYQLVDLFTFYKGAHEFTLGTQNYLKLFKTGFAPNYLGSFRFNTLTDFYNSANTGAANALLYTLQYSVTKDKSFPFSKIGTTELGFFAQDKWTVKKNFILTYGLRVDVPIFHNSFLSNPYVPLLTFRNGEHYDVGKKPNTNVLLSPRMGFNWTTGNIRKKQLRGGIGIFTGPPPFVWLSNQASNNGVQFGSFTSRRIAFSPDVTHYIPPPSENTSYSIVVTDKNYKYLKALKSTLAIDLTLPANFVATLEATYVKDINAIYFQNINLPSAGKILPGSDPRFRFDSTKIYSGNPTASNTNPDIDKAILMTNSKKGYGYALTLQLQKTISDFLFSAAYTFSAAKSLNDGASQQAGSWIEKPVTNNPNAEELGYADFYLPHRIIGYMSYRKEYAKHFATSVGFIFEAAPSGVGSYTYNGDVNNDGILSGNNDLIYIPKDQNDIVLVPVNTGIGGTFYDARTPAQIWAQLNNFINQDAYLSKHRGQLAQRNAVVFPFFKRVDVNITQDFYFTTGKHKDKHTLRFTFDLINAGNFLNRNWGTYKIFTLGNPIAPYQSSFLNYEGLVPPGYPNEGKPQFSFPYLDPANQIPLVNSFTNDTSILSRWLAQFGIRYIFH